MEEEEEEYEEEGEEQEGEMESPLKHGALGKMKTGTEVVAENGCLQVCEPEVELRQSSMWRQ